VVAPPGALCYIDGMKNIPSTSLLTEYAPMSIWDEAIKQAMRSTHKRHRTGAVVFKSDKKCEILAKGCAHKHDGGMAIASVHAEHHALLSLPKDHHNADTICIVTLTRTGNFATSSRPCISCSRQLLGVVESVIYCEFSNDGSWIVNNESIESLVARSDVQWAKYANKMTA